MRAQSFPSLFVLLLTAASCSLGACSTGGGTAGGSGSAPVGQAITAEEAASLANANAAAIADGMATKVGFLSKSEVLDSASTPCAEMPRGGPGDPVPVQDDCTGQGGFDPQQMADDFKDWLGKNILNKQFAAPSLSTATEAAFCLSADTACKTTDENGKDGIDAKCAQALAEVPLCVALTKIGDKAMTGKFLVGKAPSLIPATFALDPDKFSGKVDLAVLRQAALAYITATGEKLPEDFPQVASGVASVALAKQADLSYDFTFNIDSAVHVGAFAKPDKHFYDIKLAQTAAALVLHMGKKDRAILGSLGLNGVDVGIAMERLFGQSADCTAPVDPSGDPGKAPPQGDCPPPTNYKGAFFLALAGIGVNADYGMSADDKQETILLTGVTLGPDTAHLKFDDGAALTEIASADLNKAGSPARMADATISVTEKQVQVAVTKLLELVVVHNLEVVGTQMADLPKAFFHGQSLLRLDGVALPKVAFIQENDTPTTGPSDPPPAAPTPATFLHVLDGKLLLQAMGLVGQADIQIEVPAGQCLVEKPQTEGNKDEPAHPFAAMQAGICP